jgi:hypothetical protein
MAIDFYQIDNSDQWGYECPICKKRGKVSGDDIDYAINSTGELTLVREHVVPITEKPKPA